LVKWIFIGREDSGSVFFKIFAPARWRRTGRVRREEGRGEGRGERERGEGRGERRGERGEVRGSEGR
jgi:hypothetical protein